MSSEDRAGALPASAEGGSLEAAHLEALALLVPAVVHALRGRLNRLVLGAEKRVLEGDDPTWLRALQAELRSTADEIEACLASLARGDSGALDLAAWAREVRSIAGPSLRSAGVDLEERIPALDEGLRLKADGVRARRALTVALARWIPAMRQGSTLHVELDGSPAPRLELRCSDGDAAAAEPLPSWLAQSFAEAGLAASMAEGVLRIAGLSAAPD